MQITTTTGTYKWIKHTFLGYMWGKKKGVDELFLSENNTVMIHCEDGIVYTEHTPEQLVKLGYMELIEVDIEGDIRIAEMLESPSEPIYTKEETKPEEKPLETGRKEGMPVTDMSPDSPFYIGKPEEKPAYWYIETGEMKKSEYWEVFKEWGNKFFPQGGVEFSKYFFQCSSGYWFYIERRETIPSPKDCYYISPQQWYDTIYDGEKAQKPETLTIEKNHLLGLLQTKIEHDKAMEIPEVMVEVEKYEKLWSDDTMEEHIEALTSAIQQLQRIVFAHNNK